MSRYMYYGESENTVPYETPLVLNIRKVFASRRCLLSAVFSLLFSVAIICIAFLVYFPRTTFILAAVPVITLVQSILLIIKYGFAKRKTGFFGSGLISAIGVFEIVKAITILTLSVLFIIFKKDTYPLLSVLVQKYLPVLAAAVLGIVLVYILIAISFFKISFAVKNNMPVFSWGLISALLSLLFAAGLTAIAAVPFLWDYFLAVVARHSVFGISFLYFFEGVLLLAIISEVLAALMFFKYYKMVKKEKNNV